VIGGRPLPGRAGTFEEQGILSIQVGAVDSTGQESKPGWSKSP
jgi:hypothetical protein